MASAIAVEAFVLPNTVKSKKRYQALLFDEEHEMMHIDRYIQWAGDRATENLSPVEATAKFRELAAARVSQLAPNKLAQLVKTTKNTAPFSETNLTKLRMWMLHMRCDAPCRGVALCRGVSTIMYGLRMFVICVRLPELLASVLSVLVDKAL